MSVLLVCIVPMMNVVSATIIRSWGGGVHTGSPGSPVVCVCGDDDDGYMNLPIIRVFRGGKAGYNVETCPIYVREDDGDDCDCAMYELLSCGGYDFSNSCQAGTRTSWIVSTRLYHEYWSQ